jgi:hypothetical protein
MIKRLSLLLLLVCSTANAQFVTGQILTAQQLNNAFVNVLALSGGTLTGPLTVPTMTVGGNLTVNGTFTALGAISPSSLAPQVPNSLIGNVSNNTQSPGVVGLPSCNSSTNALNYANGAGFVCNTNINASTLGGQIFAAPGPIGSQVASTGAFTTLTVGTISVKPNLTGTTGSIGGQSLTAGTCTSGTATVTGATTAMAVSASPVTYPGDGAYWDAFVSATNTVTVKVCATVTVVPTTSAYNVRVLQ